MLARSRRWSQGRPGKDGWARQQGWRGCPAGIGAACCGHPEEAAMSDDAIMSRIRDIHPELTAIRRDIHAHPELGMEEIRTAGLVASRLREWGIPFTDG